MVSVGYYNDDLCGNDADYGSVGVRPSISLKTGFTLTGDGDGGVTNPYVVE